MIISYVKDFFALFFPELCAACGKNLFKNEEVICTSCIYHLPYTNFHVDKNNRMAKQLYGRVPFISASAFLYFKKGSKVQNLIHQLKYNHKPEVGEKIGELFGLVLKKVEDYKNVDLIIPVPLHPSKLKQRGYNQSESIAKGLSEKLDVPFSTDMLIKASATTSQTRKSRFSRYENMQAVFSVQKADLLNGKHILLVDDVFTTGATLEACAEQLLKAAQVKISIATIAYAD